MWRRAAIKFPREKETASIKGVLSLWFSKVGFYEFLPLVRVARWTERCLPVRRLSKIHINNISWSFPNFKLLFLLSILHKLQVKVSSVQLFISLQWKKLRFEPFNNLTCFESCETFKNFVFSHQCGCLSIESLFTLICEYILL